MEVRFGSCRTRLTKEGKEMMHVALIQFMASGRYALMAYRPGEAPVMLTEYGAQVMPLHVPFKCLNTSSIAL
jgi:hypothetical protein